MRIQRLEISEWEDVLPNGGIEVFHLPEALEVLDRHTTGDLELLGGFKGEEPVGLLPVHSRSKLGGKIITSPPVGFGIGRLGPVVMSSSPKQRKKESTNRKFTKAVIEELDADGRFRLFRLATSPEYSDPRPFQWNGYDISPAFTYQLEIGDTDKETVLKSFSRDLRNDIKKRDEVDFRIRTGGLEEARKTYDSVQQRFEEQDHRIPLDWEFVRDLIENLGDHARVYVAESGDGEFISGMIILYSNETAYFWKGGAKTRRSVSPNSLLHWRVIDDIITDPELDSVDTYDLYTANNQRLAKYKSGFGGEPKTYYRIESNGTAMSVAKGVYRMSVLGSHPLGKEGQL